MQSVEFEPEEIDVAEQWHGGQDSMLYALASTGSLRRGPEQCRPRVDCDECAGSGWVGPSERCRACRDRRMTDAQWLAHIADRLAYEADSCCRRARRRHMHEDADAPRAKR